MSMPAEIWRAVSETVAGAVAPGLRGGAAGVWGGRLALAAALAAAGAPGIEAPGMEAPGMETPWLGSALFGGAGAARAQTGPRDDIALGRVALDAGRYADALVYFESALRTNPNQRQAVLGRALALVKVGRAEQAITVYDALLSKSPGDSAALFYRGVAHYRMGDIDAAVTDIEAAVAGVEADPSGKRPFPIMLLRLGDAYYAQGAADRALEQYRAAMALPDAPQMGYRGVGNALYAMGDYAGAEQAYDRVLKETPGDGYAVFYRAWAREKLGRADAALDDYDRAVELIGGANADVFVARADLRRMRGMAGPALEDYRTALEIDPRNLGALYGATASLLDLGHVAATQPFLEQLVERAGADRDLGAAALFQRSRARLLRRDYSGAEKDLTLALQLRAEQPDAHYNRAIARLGLEDVAGALEDLRVVTSLRPDDPDAQYMLGRVSIAAGMTSEARSAMETAERIRGDDEDSRLSRGLTLLSLDRPLAAMTIFDRVLNDSPGQPTALRRKGDALLRSGAARTALEVAQTLITAAPDDPSGHVLEAEARIALADPGGARLALERANRLEADPAMIARLAGEAWMTEARVDEDDGGDALKQAEAALDAAVEFSSGSPADLAKRAAAHEQMGDYEKAKADLDRAVGEKPQDAEFRFARAGVLKKLGRCADAIRDYDAGLSLRPDNASARSARASCKFELGRYLGGVGDYIASLF